MLYYKVLWGTCQAVENIILLNDDNVNDAGLVTAKTNSGYEESTLLKPSNSQKTTEKNVHQIPTPIWSHGKKILNINIIVKQLYCNRCGVAFEDFEKLRHHLSHPDKNHFFQCAHCKQKFGNNLLELISHVERFCDKSKIKLGEEINASNNLGGQKYYCEICGNEYSVLIDLVYHQVFHNNIRISCPMCSYKASDLKDITDHFIIHGIDLKEDLRCSICPLRFNAPIPYKLHYYMVHSELNIPFKCYVCHEVLNNEELLATHLNHHTGNAIAIYTERKRNVNNLTCEICSKVFDNVNACAKHRIDAHDLTDESECQCPLCLKKTCVGDIISHIKSHTKSLTLNPSIIGRKRKRIRSLKCTICKEVCKSRKNLKNHKKRHLDNPSNIIRNPLVDKLEEMPIENLPFLSEKKEFERVNETSTTFGKTTMANSCTNSTSTGTCKSVRKDLRPEQIRAQKRNHHLNNSHCQKLPMDLTLTSDFSCNDCNLTFSSFQALKNHTVIHYGEWKNS